MSGRVCVVALDWDDDELDTTIEWDYEAGAPARLVAERARASRPAWSCVSCGAGLLCVDGAEAVACVPCAVVYRADLAAVASRLRP